MKSRKKYNSKVNKSNGRISECEIWDGSKNSFLQDVKNLQAFARISTQDLARLCHELCSQTLVWIKNVFWKILKCPNKRERKTIWTVKVSWRPEKKNSFLLLKIYRWHLAFFFCVSFETNNDPVYEASLNLILFPKVVFECLLFSGLLLKAILITTMLCLIHYLIFLHKILVLIYTFFKF